MRLGETSVTAAISKRGSSARSGRCISWATSPRPIRPTVMGMGLLPHASAACSRSCGWRARRRLGGVLGDVLLDDDRAVEALGVEPAHHRRDVDGAVGQRAHHALGEGVRRCRGCRRARGRGRRRRRSSGACRRCGRRPCPCRPAGPGPRRRGGRCRSRGRSSVSASSRSICGSNSTAVPTCGWKVSATPNSPSITACASPRSAVMRCQPSASSRPGASGGYQLLSSMMTRCWAPSRRSSGAELAQRRHQHRRGRRGRRRCGRASRRSASGRAWRARPRARPGRSGRKPNGPSSVPR